MKAECSLPELKKTPRYHLTAGRLGLQLEEFRHSPTQGSPSGGSLVVDAARFKLVSQDSGTEGQFRYVINDHLGAPQAVTDWTGKVVWSATYDPFGAASINADPDADGQPFTMNLRLPGQYFDAESGLSYNYLRDYDSSTGRYLESDPIGLRGGLNTFAYAAGNPLRWIDRLGLKPGDCYPTLAKAAANALSDINRTSIDDDIEYAGRINQNPDGSYSYTAPNPGSQHESDGGQPDLAVMAGAYHTHGDYQAGWSNENFSPKDRLKADVYNQWARHFAKYNHYTEFLGTPKDNYRAYDPNHQPGQPSEYDIPKASPNNADACRCSF